MFIHASVSVRHASIGYGASIGDGDIWLSFCNVGSRRAVLTAVKTKDGKVEITTGCFVRKPLAEFRAAVKKTHGSNVYALEYKAVIAFVVAFFKAHDTKNGG